MIIFQENTVYSSVDESAASQTAKEVHDMELRAFMTTKKQLACHTFRQLAS